MHKMARFVAFGYIIIVGIVALLRLTGIVEAWAPFELLPTPERPPVVVMVVHSSEQQEWLRVAVQRFSETLPTVSRRPIQIELRSQESQVMIDTILKGQSQPVAIIPAGSDLLRLLSKGWTDQHAGAPIVAVDGPNKPQPVALTPLVLVGWKQRVDLLFADGDQDVWRRLHDVVLSSGWSTLGGNAAWGLVKLGHASPLSSHSGLNTLTLLAYAYHNKNQGLTTADINDPGFQRWLAEFEQGVTDTPESSEAFFNSFLQKGPSAYDVAVAYENQAVRGLERARRQWGELRVIYPPATTWSDHPFVVLEAPWVQPDQQVAAGMFRDFLLSEPAQQLALQYGFRPANANVPLNANVPDNPFSRAADMGIRQELPPAIATPDAEVQMALKTLWRQQGRR